MPSPKRTPPNTRPQQNTTSRPLPPPTASERAFERLVAEFDSELFNDLGIVEDTRSCRDNEFGEGMAQSEDSRFLDGLFAKRDEYLTRDRFATIGDANEFFTKVVGVSFEGRQDVAAGLREGQSLELVRQPENPVDPNAVAVRYGALPIGFLKKDIAKRLAPNIDAGDRYTATVGSVTGGGAKNVGVNIFVRRVRVPQREQRKEAARELASTDALRVALIGERPLRDAQRAVLARVERGVNTLAVLGTGRGKSLCFQLPAAERALARGEKTLVFYPLRALANDQFDALTRRLDGFGLRVLRANGSIDGAERDDLDAALADGSWDIILSTPEYATYHREAFSRACNRPSFVVVDEAHHLFESKHRPAYGMLGELIASLGKPQLLALTATANDDAFRTIRSALAIESWIIDPTVRANLHLIDARNTSDKNAYLARELDGDGKAIVYCNSRAEVTKLAERLRTRFGPSVAFYHAGVPNAERRAIEDLFRRGGVRLVVATSAFGEGIDLPDVRDVVLYHLNFDFTEFNQMSGRAGRDGLDARIHLLYGDGDRRINDFIIGRSAPSLEVLRELYRGIKSLATGNVVRMSHEDIARTLDLDMADGSTVGAAIRIFNEGGLVETGIDEDGRFVRFLDATQKVDLTKTTRYAEGLAEREGFEKFCGLALIADAPTLEQIVNRPIYPDRVPLEA
jgi:single-stranded-DNA-specific exonuclease